MASFNFGIGRPWQTHENVLRAEASRVEEVEPLTQRVQAFLLGGLSREYLHLLFVALGLINNFEQFIN